jgi:hypothetical protein
LTLQIACSDFAVLVLFRDLQSLLKLGGAGKSLERLGSIVRLLLLCAAADVEPGFCFVLARLLDCC